MTTIMVSQVNSKPVQLALAAMPSKILTLGLGTAVGFWVLWFALHLPGLDLSAAIVGPAMLLGWVVLAAILARLIRPSLVEGALAGLFTAIVSLLALGSALVVQPDPASYAEGQAPLRPAAALLVLGFLLVGAIIGALSTLAAGRRDAEPDIRVGHDPWPSRLAIAVAAAYVPLVLLGGAVTSTESGMAVRGWPDTFGANMFLYPISLMSQPRIFLEHSHRLFGTLAGVATILLWLMTLSSHETRRRFGVWTTVLLAAICLQGYLGGQRVVQNNQYLGAVHGAFGQVLLAFAAVLALWMSPRYLSLHVLAGVKRKRLRSMVTAALVVSLLQLLFGALYRHLRRGDNPGASHVVMVHAAFSFVVITMAIIAGAMLIRFAKENRDALPRGLSRRLRIHGAAIHAVIAIQFTLGWFALLAVMTGKSRGPVPTADQLGEAPRVPLGEALLTTSHQANGALYLVLIMLAWAWARRLHRAARA